MAQSLTQEQIGAVTDAIFAGQKIEAMKLYREASGASLVEAKEFVEKLEAELRLQYPGRFAVAPPARSMMPIVIFVVIASGIAIVLLLLS